MATTQRTVLWPVGAGLVLVLGLLTALLTVPGTAHATTHDDHPGFVAVQDVAPSLRQDMRYPSHHNFVGRPIDGYRQPICVLTKPAAHALARAQTVALRRGYTLKVYDCYRPQRAVDDFKRWSERTEDTRMKDEFYPTLDKSQLFELGYIANKSGHSRGSTMDLTLVKLPTKPQRPYVPGEPLSSCYAPSGQRFPDNSIEMGTGFDCFDTRANTDDPRITGKAHAHRMLLKHIMEKSGFKNLDLEWWHYTLKDEPYPDTYFDFPVSRSALPQHG